MDPEPLFGTAPLAASSPRAEDADPRRWGAALAVILLAAAAVRLPTLGRHALVEGDGVHYASLARDLLALDFSGLGNPYWSNLWPGAIALTSLLTGLDVVAAGRVASLVSGCLLAPLTALLARRAFGPVAGLAGGLLVAGHPWLAHFSTLVFTESFFAVLLVTLLLAGMRAAASGRTRDVVLTGVLGGLGVTTRPEAFAVTLLLGAALLLAARRGRRMLRGLGALTLLLAILAAFLGARALLVRYYYDEWDFAIGAKGTANLFVGLAASDAERERVTGEVTPEGENKLAAATRSWTLVSFARAHPRLLVAHLWRNLGRVGDGARRVFPPVPVHLGRSSFPGRAGVALDVLALLTLGAAGLGLAAGLADAASRPATLLLAANAALYVLGVAAFNVHDRLIVAVVPLVLVFVGHGVALLARVVAVRLRGRAAGGGLEAGLLAPLLVLPALAAFALLRSPALPYADDPPVQREAGLWLRTRLDQETRLMTASPAIAFYFYDAPFQDNEVDIPWADYDTLLAHARRSQAGILAASEWYLEAIGHPAAAALLDPTSPRPGLRPIATLGRDRPYRVFIYALERDGG